jgi:protease IV
MHHASLISHTRAAALAAVLAFFALSPAARAQNDTRYADEPTQGLHLPAVPLAGEHDAFTVTKNPAGVRFLRGWELGLGLDLTPDDDLATTAGPGLGLFLASRLGGGILPEYGLGLGLELLRPSRVALDPDPGSPVRFTLATALPLGSIASLGFSYHHFFDSGGITDGLDTWDIGLAARLGARFAMGAVVRDVAAPQVAGAPVQRRYELEFVTRPLATDRLELALGGRVGEVRADLDGWTRLSARLLRGVYLRAELTSRELALIETTPTGTSERFAREWALSAGLEISLGRYGVTAMGTGARGHDGQHRMAGGTLLVRASQAQVPSALGPGKRIERVEISGQITARTHTALVLRLRAIARDPAVVAVVVPIDDIGAGWATVQELRRELLRVRKAGKKIFAYVTVASTRDYYLATAADRIYVDPVGGVRLVGLAGTSVYFKGMFDKLGVSAQFEKIEEYKSAPESWTREWPSQPAREVHDAIYDSIYAGVINSIAESRGITPEMLRQLVDEGLYSAGDLQGSPLVDAVATPEQIGKLIVKELGASYPVAGPPPERPERWSVPAIAVVYVEGDIVDGKSRSIPLIGRTLVGGDTVAQAIAAARADPRVKAIVLRIDSPGGSVFGSEVIYREARKTREVKPVICSLGDLAASGGYYAAAACDVIFAEPMTITGSIGIFYGKFDFSELLSRLGVTWATYKRGEHSDMESYFRPYSAEERVMLKSKLRYSYERFLELVAKSRGMTSEKVDAIARGRVWTGAQAKDIGLVDQLGGLADAIAFAKARVGLADHDRARLVLLPRIDSNLLGRLLGISGVTAKDSTSTLDWLPGGKELLQALPASLLAQPGVLQARLPFAIIWH